jgi:hypothetical protein
MTFDDLTVPELQDLVDQTIVLVAVENDDGVNTLVDAFGGGTNVGPNTRPQRPTLRRSRRTKMTRRRKATTTPFSSPNGRLTRQPGLLGRLVRRAVPRLTSNAVARGGFSKACM